MAMFDEAISAWMLYQDWQKKVAQIMPNPAPAEIKSEPPLRNYPSNSFQAVLTVTASPARAYRISISL